MDSREVNTGKKKNHQNNGLKGILLFVCITIIPIFTNMISVIKVPLFINISVIALVFALIMLMYFFMVFFYSKSVDSIKESVRGQVDSYFPINIFEDKIHSHENNCIYHNFICCADEVINGDFYNELKTNLVLDKATCERYCIMNDDDFDNKEATFFDDNADGEIWVVSYALETEVLTPQDRQKSWVDPSLLRSMETVSNNIKKGGKYVQFVALGPGGEAFMPYRNRRDVYWSILQNKDEDQKKELLPVIRIDSDFSGGRGYASDPDLDFLVRLTSTVLFVSKGDQGETIEGYFCLRPDAGQEAKAFERRTIMYKMPDCMRDRYYEFLSIKKDAYQRTLKEEKNGRC